MVSDSFMRQGARRTTALAEGHPERPTTKTAGLERCHRYKSSRTKSEYKRRAPSGPRILQKFLRGEGSSKEFSRPTQEMCVNTPGSRLSQTTLKSTKELCAGPLSFNVWQVVWAMGKAGPKHIISVDYVQSITTNL